MACPALRGRRVLVVEDEYLIAVSLRDHLEAVGSTVIGPVPSVEKAIRLIESNRKIDVAVLDINLGGEMADPVADTLAARHIPFVFTSGYEHHELAKRYPQVKNCLKPYRFVQVGEALASALQG